MQRSFAAELLSPFNEIEHELGGDLSDEAQQEIAEHFDVSPNHGRLDRAELEEDQTSVDEDQVLVAAAARPAPR